MGSPPGGVTTCWRTVPPARQLDRQRIALQAPRGQEQHARRYDQQETDEPGSPAARGRAGRAKVRLGVGVTLGDGPTQRIPNKYLLQALVQTSKVHHVEVSKLNYCRSIAMMLLYRLTPTNLNDPNWRTSIYRDVAVVRADSEEQARSLVSKAFDTTLVPSSPGGKIATPRWQHPHAVRAEVVQDQRYRAEGRVGSLEPWGYS